MNGQAGISVTIWFVCIEGNTLVAGPGQPKASAGTRSADVDAD